MGEVERINGLKLGVAKGPDNSSVLTSKGQDVSLEKRTFLLLIPARGVFPHGPADVEVARQAEPWVAGDGPALPADVSLGELVPTNYTLFICQRDVSQRCS